MGKNSFTDQQLVSMIRMGRRTKSFEQAVERLTELLQPMVESVFQDFNLLRKRNIIGVEDVLNYTLKEIILGIEEWKYKGKGSLVNYGHTIARNKCLREKEKLTKVKDASLASMNSTGFHEDVIPVNSSQTFIHDDQEAEEAIMHVLQSNLSEEELEDLRAIALDGKSYEEYAKEKKEKAGTIKVRVFRIRKKLKDLFNL